PACCEADCAAGAPAAKEGAVARPRAAAEQATRKAMRERVVMTSTPENARAPLCPGRWRTTWNSELNAGTEVLCVPAGMCNDVFHRLPPGQAWNQSGCGFRPRLRRQADAGVYELDGQLNACAPATCAGRRHGARRQGEAVAFSAAAGPGYMTVPSSRITAPGVRLAGSSRPAPMMRKTGMPRAI